VVLVLPPWGPGLHGDREIQAFERLTAEAAAPQFTQRLCRLVLLGILPALAERDLAAFGEAVHAFNRHVGEAFAPVQGGPYAHASTEEVVCYVRGQGVRGIGQSSWGPAIFAIVEDEGRADALVKNLRQHFGLGYHQVFRTRACNRGATVHQVE
jgi:predicted sugar kinase